MNLKQHQYPTFDMEKSEEKNYDVPSLSCQCRPCLSHGMTQWVGYHVVNVKRDSRQKAGKEGKVGWEKWDGDGEGMGKVKV
jgi:hypothetical protein